LVTSWEVRLKHLLAQYLPAGSEPHISKTERWFLQIAIGSAGGGGAPGGFALKPL